MKTNEFILEYFNGKEWYFAGGPFISEEMAWASLGGDDVNYRVIDGDLVVLTDKSVKDSEKFLLR